jgi:hypothetical protein
MNYVGSVNMMFNGKVITIPVAKVMYQNGEEGRPAGGVVENADGAMEIILDGRLSEEASNKSLEAAMEEISRRIATAASN